MYPTSKHTKLINAVIQLYVVNIKKKSNDIVLKKMYSPSVSVMVGRETELMDSGDDELCSYAICGVEACTGGGADDDARSPSVVR